MVSTAARALNAVLLAAALPFLGLGLGACGGAGEATIGPEGGELELSGVKVVIPPGALGQSRVLKITPTDADLSRGGFKQAGGAFLLEPTDLILKIPATVTFSKLKDVNDPAVLFVAGEGGRVHTFTPVPGQAIGYIGAFGTVAAANAGPVMTTIDEPLLVATPEEADAAAPSVDVLHFKLTPTGLSFVDIVLSAYDLRGEHNRDLNGGAHCGFKIENVIGGSIATGCTRGLATATITPDSSVIEFDAVPFLIGKVDTPVIVQVGVGSTEFANTLGYATFKTSPCFSETCSGRGVCVEQGGGAACECNPGYGPAPDELKCECIPNCAGRQCGPDSCGGTCAPGCGGGSMCDNDAGVCGPVPDPTTTTTDPTTDGTTDPTTDGTTTDGTTTDGTTTDGTTTGTTDGTTTDGTTDPTTDGTTT